MNPYTYFDRLNRQSLTMRDFSLREEGDVSMVSAHVAGRNVWFKCEGARLRPDAVAYINAYFLSALKTGRRIYCEQQVDPQRLSHLPQVAKLIDGWWGLGAMPELRVGQREGPELGRKSPRTGLFFSCGVDSFDTLLQRAHEIDDLILVHGFDVALEDTQRFAALKAQAALVAEAMGKRLIVIETNLREHRVFQKGSWVRNHGSALTAVGHLLADEVGRVLISASYPSDALKPWGSHPLLDHLWSSASLKVEHTGDVLWRIDKIARQGDNALFRQHLMVCWVSKGLPLNCGRCEKCVRNQLAFLLTGHTIPASFPKNLDLAEAIRGNPRIKAFSNIYAIALESDTLSAAIKEAITALIERSQLSLDTSHAVGSGWDASTVNARVKDHGKRTRHEGGSPNSEEIEAYGRFLPSDEAAASGTVLVLGMTPELRHLAASRFKQVVSVDSGAAAIRCYRDWLPPELREREKVYAIDWGQLPYVDWSVVPPVRAVLGDGVFGNLPDTAAHVSFLAMLRELFPEATLVFRKALAQSLGDSDDAVLEDLMAAFRGGQIGPDEFGFSVRLQGFLNSHYRAETALLDNASLFQACEQRFKAGFFNDFEIEAIRRFHFNGPNCLLTEQDWEGLLREAGFTFQKSSLSGRRWYSFYPVYAVRPTQPSI